MSYCYFCYHGWPPEIAAIYSEALAKLDGHESPLHFGPAHIVWEDENFDSAQWCLDNFDEYTSDYTKEEMDVVRESLVQLAALPDSLKHPPPGFEDDDENPDKYPPPWKGVKR